MATCSIRWRPSGGRGEFEFVPAESLRDRDIAVDFDALNLRIPSEVRGEHVQGKPRLRKFESNNRKKLHLPQLVMAVAGLPEPARSDRLGSVEFPLENKKFVMDRMDFDIIDDDGFSVVLAPLRVTILHSDFQIQLDDRLKSISKDLKAIDSVRKHSRILANALQAHFNALSRHENSNDIRKTADRMIRIKSNIFGMTNAGSAVQLLEADGRTPVEEEGNFVGIEGRLLMRIHVYKERDKQFAQLVRKHKKYLNGGRLICEACQSTPEDIYGPKGENCMEAHHKIPVKQLQPDSITPPEEMAMVCANCHRVIHSRNPCLTIDEMRSLLGERGPATAA